MTTLAEHIDAARSAALAPEQDLLLMLARRVASRRVMEAAERSYRRAAAHMTDALKTIPPIEKDAT